MLEIISGGDRPGVPRLRRRRHARSGRSSWPGSPGWPGRSSTTASATGCSSTSTSARATSSSSCSAAAWPASAVGAMGARHHARRRRPRARRPVRPRGRRLAAARRRHGRSASASIVAIGILLAAVCLQTRQESWSYPEAVGRRAVPRQRRRLPAVRPARRRSRRSACVDAADLVDRGRPAARSSRAGSSSIGGAGSLWTSADRDGRPGRRPRSSSPCWRPGRWLHSPPSASSGSSERRAKDRGLLDQTTGS